jgi:hypothetical protein
MRKLILFIAFITFLSCEEESFKTQESYSKKEVSNFFKARNIEVSFNKPKHLQGREVKTNLKFTSLEQLEVFLDSTSKLNNEIRELEFQKKDAITHVDNEGGSNDLPPSFVKYSKSVPTLLGPLYLNYSFVLDTDNCEPSSINSWITGNLHVSDYTQTNKYLQKSTEPIKTKTSEYYLIHSGVQGVITYTLEIPGAPPVYKSDNVSDNNTKTCYEKK